MSDDEQSPGDALAQAQLFFTDVRRSVPFFGGGFGDNKKSGFNKTDFESRELNDMVDMVDKANPADLEAVGDALEAAAKEIESVGTDLGKHISGVPWEGEAGEAFRTWGSDLAKNTQKLADFTQTSSTQIKAAGLGLAMVKSSMPPRDDGGVGSSVAKIPESKRNESNKDYTEAKAADAAAKEKVRQEAIGQMNKLSSYYQVSHDTMYGQEEPVFKPLNGQKIGMPPAPPGGYVEGGGAGSSQVASGHSSAVPTTGEEGASPSRGGVAGETGSSRQSPAVTDRQVGTEIASVKAPPPTTGPSTQAPPSNVGQPPGPQVSPIVGPGPSISPMRPGGNKVPTGPGTSKMGQSPPGGNRNTTTGKTPTSMGRPPITGQQGMGRPPAAGQSPMGGRPSSTTPPRMGRSAPIVGGTPAKTGPASAPRIPRGTVIGGEHGATGRGGAATGMPGGRGPAGTGLGQASTGRATTPGGVTGAPRGTGAAGRGVRPFTPGGTGLIRGGESGRSGMAMTPRGQYPSPRERERDDSRRPDFLVEDEETWTRGRGDSAPPVIE